MTDLQTRFKTLDTLSAPDLWYSIEERAMAMQPARRSNPWVLVAVMLLLVLAIGGAVLVGSGIVKLPAVVDESASPSASAQASTTASSSQVEHIPASWTATGNMIEARTNHTATPLLDGRVLVAGGLGIATAEGVSNVLASSELYDPSTGQWTSTGAMLGVRNGHAATLLPDGRVLVAGGSACTDFDGCPLDSAEVYDPESGTWAATGPMLQARSGGHTATLLGTGKVLMAGGNSIESGAVATAELYDPASGAWTATGTMVAARQGHTATRLLDGRVLVAGSGTEIASAELYDPVTGEWTTTGSLGGFFTGHAAILLLDGKVLVTGGMAGTGAMASALLFDTSTGQWTSTGLLSEGRLYHEAILLPGGRVLVAGGASSVIDLAAIDTAEVFDPVSESWTATLSMGEARVFHTIALLRDGTVLVAGGTGSGSGALASAELYDPGTGS